MIDLLLRHARLVTARAELDADLAIAGGRLAWLGPAGEGPAATRTIELDGRLVLPGLIDAHVHFREPGAHARKGTYASESRAAAAGGVTCVLTMPNTSPFCGTREVLEQTRDCARGRTWVDYGFQFGVQPDHLGELTAVRNVPAFKLYLNETTGIASPLCDDDLLARVMALGQVLTAHAEGDTLDWLLDLHARFGTGPLYLVHVALAREVAAIRAAKARGQWLYAEATPHHLFLDTRELDRLGPYGDMRPTLKSPEDVAALWDGLADGTIDTLATDHAPHLREEKESPKPPPGVPGLQTALPLYLTAVREGRLTLHDLVRLSSRNPARVFGLRDKGELRVGAHADLVVVDPDAEQVIRDEDQLTLPGWTPFAGRKVVGQVQLTLLRGQVIYDEQGLVGEPVGEEVATWDPGLRS